MAPTEDHRIKRFQAVIQVTFQNIGDDGDTDHI